MSSAPSKPSSRPELQSQTLAVDKISYQDLYQKWEQGNWSAMAIDLSKDVEGWQQLNPIQVKSAIWLYSMFFYGEESVTDNLSPFIAAAPTEEQKYFLTTQQVDEARHSIFFHRFFKEVIQAGETAAEALAFAEAQLSWPYRNVFARLDKISQQLKKDQSLPVYAQAIAMYHMVVEGSMAQPGQHLIVDSFAKKGLFPGFSEGMSHVERDEQRHIAFGVKVLSELFRQSEECKAAVAEILAEVFPYTSAVFIPPDFDESYLSEYETSLQEIYSAAMQLSETRWKTTGYPLTEMPAHVYPLDTSLSFDQRAQQHIMLLKAGFLREAGSEIQFSPEAQKYYFQIMANSLDRRKLPAAGLSIQFTFDDAPDWYLLLSPTRVISEEGVISDPDLKLSLDWKSWVKISRGANPLPLLLHKQMKLKGLKALYPLGQALPPRTKVWAR